MHVKKFEAKTMKEALEMVKVDLGPDAIILTAKDNSKKYGLVGEGSVEVTAAISEGTLRKKQFVEQKLPENKRELLQKSPAKNQKQIITKVINSYQQEQIKLNQPSLSQSAVIQPAIPYQTTSTNHKRYIDILDEESTPEVVDTFSFNTALAKERIKNAAQKAFEAIQFENINLLGGAGGVQSQDHSTSLDAQSNNPDIKSEKISSEVKTDSQIQSLQNEILELKNIITGFKSMPSQFLPSSHPGSEFGIGYELSFIFEKLQKSGVTPEYIADLVLPIQESMPSHQLKKRGMVEGIVAKNFLESLKISDLTQDQKIQIFMGASGHGKTSTLIKMASHAAIREKKRVAIVSTDSIKVGAAEQLKIYSQILNVPFLLIRKLEDWEHIRKQISEFDRIFVDTPGFGLRYQSELVRIRQLLPPSHFNSQIHLVISGTAKDQDAFEIGKRFEQFKFSDVIFTALDESTQHGVIYNFQKHFQKPIHGFGVGSNIPEDYESASKERILDLIFKISENFQISDNQMKTA